MCIIVSFYEVLPAGTFHEEGNVGRIPDGRGIRHYDEHYACRESSSASPASDPVIVPTRGYVQISPCTGTTCDDDAYPHFEDAWQEYAIASHNDIDILDIEYLPGTYASIEFTRRHDIDVENIENEPHKDINGDVYIWRLTNVHIHG